METSKKTTEEYSKQGKKNRAAGVRFEANVREDLNSQGWILDKWTNNVDFEKNKVVPAKRKYNPFMKALSIGNGFPDFIGFKLTAKRRYDIIGVEVKRRGYLDSEEKKKCEWYLKNKIFSRILIARAVKNGVHADIEYADFEDKYLK